MSGKSPLTQQLLQERGPDDFVNSCLQKDVLQCVILDECGPFFLKSGPKPDQVYIMVGVELVSYRCHLIPMQDTTTKSLIRALETLQGLRGRLTALILDETQTHLAI